jgi:hypothetical protein
MAVILLILADLVLVSVWFLYGEASSPDSSEAKPLKESSSRIAQMPLLGSLLKVSTKPPDEWVGHWSNDTTSLNIYESGRVVSEDRAVGFVSGHGDGVLSSFSERFVAVSAHVDIL